jgi:ABC-2 type transport system permease protein
MRNLRLVFNREFQSRITDKWFWLATLLGPVFIAIISTIPAVISYITSQAETKIAVIDKTDTLQERLSEAESNLSFSFPDRSKSELKNSLKEDPWEGVLIIPDNGIEKPGQISYISYSNLPLSQKTTLSQVLEDTITDVRYAQAGIDKQKLQELQPDVSVQTQLLGEQKASSGGVALGFGLVSGLIMYFILLTYGSMVMKSVLQEKKNRLVDLVISSVRPFDLMLGKITAIIALSLTQIAIWVGLGTLFIRGIQTAPLPSQGNQILSGVLEGLEAVNLVPLVLLFGAMFLGGYLLYAALFAMISSAADPDAEVQTAQQIVMFPIIISVLVMMGAIQNPDGAIAFWGSMVPLSSPMVMIARFPFQVPGWEIVLSLVILYGSAFFILWLAARIYRVAILFYGQRPGPGTMLRWIVGRE